jgi:hypothetical protein
MAYSSVILQIERSFNRTERSIQKMPPLDASDTLGFASSHLEASAVRRHRMESLNRRLLADRQAPNSHKHSIDHPSGLLGVISRIDGETPVGAESLDRQHVLRSLFGSFVLRTCTIPPNPFNQSCCLRYRYSRTGKIEVGPSSGPHGGFLGCLRSDISDWQ